MTRDDIIKQFPRASEAFIFANLSRDSAGPTAFVESRPRPVPLAADKAQEKNRPRFLVRVVSVRSRLLDEDNLCAKYHVDLCRYAGAVPGDSPESCRIETTQRKALKGETEHTEITIWKQNENAQIMDAK